MSVVFATKWENMGKYFPEFEPACRLPGQTRPAKGQARGSHWDRPAPKRPGYRHHGAVLFEEDNTGNSYACKTFMTKSGAFSITRNAPPDQVRGLAKKSARLFLIKEILDLALQALSYSFQRAQPALSDLMPPCAKDRHIGQAGFHKHASYCNTFIFHNFFNI